MAVPTEAEKIRMQIKNILMSEAFLPENEANELTEAIMNSAQGQVAAVDDEITDILKRQIQTLLDDYAITGENRDEVGAYLLDRLFNPTDNDEDLLEVIKNKGGLSDKNARSMLKQLGAVSNMSMETFKSLSRTSTPKKRRSESDTLFPPGTSKKGKVPTYNDALNDKMMGWMDNLPKHLQPNLDKADVQKRLKGLSDKIEKLKGQPDADRKIRALLDKELPMIFEDLDEDDIKRLGSSLLNNLNKDGFTDDTWSPPGSSKSSKSGKVPTYNDALQDEMMGWMDNLPKHLQPNLDKADVQKRLKGLSDKIEKLKGQPDADRKIRALLDKELPMIFEDLDEDEIKRLGSSLLNNLKKEGFTDDTWSPPGSSKSSKSGKVPTYNDALQDEMMGWMDNLPKHLQPNLDKADVQKRRKGLSDKIEKLKGKPDADRKIRAILDKELPMIFEDLDEDEIKRLGSSLFNNLKKDGFTDGTLRLPNSKSDKIPTYNEALNDKMMGWMDNLPKHLQPNLDKADVQKRLKGLSDKIEKLKGQPNADRKIRALLDKELPMIFEDLDEDEIKRLGSSLLNNLKKEGFTDDTWSPPGSSKSSKSGKVPTYNDALQDEMMGWMDNLPKHLQPNLDKADVQKRLKGLSDKIEKLKGQPDADRKIRALLDKELPMIFEDLDEDEIKRLGSSLLNNLKKEGFTDDTWSPPGSSKSSKSGKVPTYNDALQDEMMGWMDNLPKHLQPNLDKGEVQKRLKGLSDKIEKLKGQPDADRKIRALLDKDLPMIFEDLDEDEIKRLGSSLLNNLKKEGFTDDTWRPPNSKSDKIPTYNEALNDKMMGWMDNLPKHLQQNLDKTDVQKRLKGLSDKIEKLKGQPNADRKIRALLDKELPMIFEDLDEDEIKRLGSSLLNNLKKEGFTDDTWRPPNSKSDKIPTYNEALNDKMMGWMDNLPKHLQPNLDKGEAQKRLKGLSDKIEKLKGQPNADRKIRALLDKELPMIFEDLDEDEIKRLGSSLLNNLKKEGFTDDTWRPPNSKSDKIPTYNEALNDKMMGWMDNLPKHLQPNLDKGEAQKRLKGLSDKIEKLKGQPDADRKIRALLDKELPMIFEDLDEDEIKRLGSSLFNNLNKDGFTDDTWSPPGSSKSSKSGKVPTYNDALQDEMMGWMDNLPKHLQPNLDKADIQKRLKGLSDKIEKLKGQPDADRKIRALLDKELPMIFEDLDEDEIKRLGSSLLNNLKKEGFTDDTWRPPNSKSDKIPTYNEALNDKMMGWMDNLPKHLQPNLDKADVQKRLKGLSDKIEKLKDQPDAGRKIRDLLDKELPLIFENLDPDEVKRLGSSLFNNLKKNGFTDNTWKPPTRQTSDIAEQNLISSVEEWLKQTPMYQKATSEEKSQMKSAAKDIAKGIKRAVSIAKLTPGTDMDDMVREQIIKGLKNVIVDPKLKTDEEFLNTTADNIINYLKTKKAYQDLTSKPTETLPNMLDAAVDNWTKKLAVDNKTPQQQEQYNKNKQNFVSRLKQARSQFHPSSPEHSIAIKDEGRKFLRLNLTDPNKKADEKYIEKYVNILETALQTIPIEHDDTIKNSIKPYKSPADTLYDYIEDWVQSLPVQGDPEKINLMKQNLASKLVNKIGELNINPDIFNDAALYQDLLQEEIDKLLDEIPKNPELNKYLPALKRDFISKIMDARQNMLKELGGKFYKQHLRDKISTSLPLPSCLTADEEASFEILKDKVADAFINLHYASCDQSENQRYKSQISHELNKFVHEIFYNHPCGKLDPEKLKNDLFKALSRVPIPRDDVMESEIEQARIRELIYDWMQDLPLRQETVTEKLHRYKLASVLAKRLHDIEMEKQANDFIDSDYKISEEISRFLNKLLLIKGQESKIPGLVKKLMNILKYTEQSRTFVSTSQRCQRDVPSTDICSRYPTTLSPEDQDHLNRIKIRRGKACNKDVGVCPLISTSSQTDYRGQNQVEKRTSPVKRVTSPKSCSAMPQTKDAACMTPRESPCHIQPKVFVKEFIWESLDSCEGIEQGVQTSQSLVEATAGPSGGLKKSIDQPGTYSSFARPLQEQKSPCTNSLCSRKSRYVEDEFSSEEESFPRPGFSRYDRTCRKGPKVLEDRSKRPCLRSRRMVSDRRFREDEVAHNPWSRYRMRREGFRLLDNDSNKCNCKDRIQVSCKGYRNRYIDMCQACGSTCPHPSPPFFK
ncbi:hypothetical protein O0L34_g13426 [Tuta absoluta]|nr:hypothetical protein O0L34_g13426 [Tuta absoluta]